MKTSIHLAALAALLPSTIAQTTNTDACSPLKLVYSRATGEPGLTSPTAGYGAAGYALLTNLTALVPGASGHALDYPAGFLPTSSNIGTTALLTYLSSASTRCPSQRYALGGHSQGGNVTYHAIPRIPAEILSKIVAVTMFGSPKCQPQVVGRCNSYCYVGDFACDGPGGGKFGNGGTESLNLRVKREEMEMAVNCEKLLALKPQGEKSRFASGFGGAHMSYAADGVYVQAAACYIKQQFEKSKAAGAR
ncbi:alpha/beta-hydrolase [Microthyrium microscopicum]|uniref:Alpha/beta-hydrolase n=1 Tax=Microthyrium microscopicum TaxID=703497 RepID=A0A6A6U399_9PEZI|nr:alpha/beta-hydrolase [Microthyrium microscopicum]